LTTPTRALPCEGSGAKRKSPFQLAQELLNASPAHEWALVSNGKTLRLLRDAATLTRPSYLEVDLQDLLAGQRFVEFGSAWRLLHASRAGLLDVSTEEPGKTAPPVVWASWQQAGQEEGTRVRERPAPRASRKRSSAWARASCSTRPTTPAPEAASGQPEARTVLRPVAAPGLPLHLSSSPWKSAAWCPGPAGDDEATAQARKAAAAQLYADGYAMARLRDLALRRRAHTRFDDLWQAVRIVFRGLDQGQPRLGLPALGGLFAASQCEDLDTASLSNADLLATMKSLRWAANRRRAGAHRLPQHGHRRARERLRKPAGAASPMDVHARRFGLPEAAVAATARPAAATTRQTALVQELIRSALDPVIEDRVAKNPAQPVEALLSLRVVDPACGSGHFLLAAARRLAERVASLALRGWRRQPPGLSPRIARGGVPLHLRRGPQPDGH
jgi:hypothetical protein